MKKNDYYEQDAWVARDYDGSLRLFYAGEPHKWCSNWMNHTSDNGNDWRFCIDLPHTEFPNVVWSDEKATKVRLSIDVV